MSDTSDQSAKQRFLDLKVGNVDIVDEPANLVDFVAIKSMEGSPMSTANSTKAAGNTEGNQGPTGTSAQPPLNDKCTNVSTDLSSMVAELSKACSGGMDKMDEEMKKKLKALSKALDAAFGTDVGNETDKSAKKSNDNQAVDTAKAGGKQFTKERMDTISNSLKALLGMVKSLDEDTYKALTAPDPDEGTAGVKPLIPSVVPTPETQKAMTELSGAVKSLTESVALISKRLDAVDSGSTKTPADNATETTKPATKSLWSGVL